MSIMLDTLEWLARYGFIDIIFGIGVISFLRRLIRRALPTNYEFLHVDVSPGVPGFIPDYNGKQVNVDQSFSLRISNSGRSNFYVARAYFRAKQRRWRTLWLWRTPTQIRVHPRSARIADKDAFELKFPDKRPEYFEEYEALIRPGSLNGQMTWLALEQPVEQRLIDKRRCGVLYVEYATSGRQGVHRVRV